MNEKYKITDTRAPLPKVFVKLGKQGCMTKYINEGSLRFSSALEFSKIQEGIDKIADKYEGALFLSNNRFICCATGFCEYFTKKMTSNK